MNDRPVYHARARRARDGWVVTVTLPAGMSAVVDAPNWELARDMVVDVVSHMLDASPDTFTIEMTETP
jgi:hypothetical protein